MSLLRSLLMQLGLLEFLGNRAAVLVIALLLPLVGGIVWGLPPPTDICASFWNRERGNPTTWLPPSPPPTPSFQFLRVRRWSPLGAQH